MGVLYSICFTRACDSSEYHRLMSSLPHRAVAVMFMCVEVFEAQKQVARVSHRLEENAFRQCMFLLFCCGRSLRDSVGLIVFMNHEIQGSGGTCP